ncbi:N-acetyltransferase ESCO zinc-finger [Trinorchestia longiramus]|nr:N-acetyltransferase ESCO zinc-finger [Trinorchestia longiramus]
MSSFLPDCGILSSPSLSMKEVVHLPPVSSLSAVLGTGASVSFYGPQKTTTPTVLSHTSLPAMLPSRGRRRKADAINKGVSHGIKKPNLKAKNRAKKQAKITVRRLKQAKPQPRLAEHRSPAVKPSSQFKKRHQLSSPGKALLDVPECGDFMPAKCVEGKKIFTSRARAAATVQITKNVLLSANYGEVTLQQRASSIGLKKNIGRNTTEKPEPVTSTPLMPVNMGLIASKIESNKPKPTRFLAYSPVSKRADAEKENSVGAAPVRSSPRCRQPLPQTDQPAVARCLYQASPTKRSRSPAPEVAPVRASPRRSPCVLSPQKSLNTPTKGHRDVSLRTSVLRQLTPTKGLCPTRSSPRRSSNNSSPVRNSPSRANLRSPLPELTAVSPSKGNSPFRGASTMSPSKSAQSSPRRTMTRDSPLRSKFLKPTARAEQPSESEEVESNTTSSSQNSGVSMRSGALKYFPIFDPERRRSHSESDKLASKSRGGGIRAARGDSSQMILDAGQKEFGATQCKECGLVYEHADPDDETLHDSYHNRVISALSYSNWKKERQISAMDSHGGRCILVRAGDPHYCWRKIEEVLTVVDEELGFESNTTIKGKDVKAVLYVTEGKVVGLLIAESIGEAYRVLPNTVDASHEETLLCCSEDPQPVKFGISRLWVQKDKRRSGLATKLVDAFRGHMIMYHYLKLDEFAFSDPTPNGLNFARKYTAKEDFLVYRHGI